MAKTIKMPVLGNSVEEVRIVQWFKKVGDTVASGEPLAEVETDKTSMEWESPESGVLLQILAEADSYVKVEAPVAVMGAAGETVTVGNDLPAAPVVAEAIVASAPNPVNSAPIPVVNVEKAGAEIVSTASSTALLVSPRAQRMAEELGVDTRLLAGRGTGPKGRIQEKDILEFHAALAGAEVIAGEIAGRGLKASPLARAVAADTGMDLSTVSGSGTGGRIFAGDVRAATPEPVTQAIPTPQSPPLSSATAGGTKTVTLTGLRKRVADNLLKSVRNAPHVTLNASVDMTEAMRLRSEILPAIEKATGVRVSPTDIIVKACSLALHEHPGVNAHIDGDTITLFEDVHIGLAVSLGEEGLIVPIIRDVLRKGLSTIAADRADLAARARIGKLASSEVSGGTFTVTNLGNYGIDSFNPIIAPPQVAILGIGSISDTIVAREGAAVVRPMMGLSLSFDHRAMDGAPAAAFLARIREILEKPYLLLL
jgi:pyruvate dehydrogenase E2 component (dihydrolipoamide acetyltransferase)